MKISVITATYNSGKTIRDTIESVKRQTYPDVEHVIQDGGSVDDTVSICQEYEGVKLVSERDKGIYDAMNKGILRASGDIIGILNSDDFYTSEDVLQCVADEFEKDPGLEAVYGDIHFVASSATLANPGKCTRYYSSAMFRPWLLRFGFMPAHPSFYVRREVYEKYGLYDLDFRISSDFEWMVRLFAKEHIKAKYIKKDFVTMRAGGESTNGMEAKRKVNNDIMASLRKHDIYTCSAFKYVRYAWKGLELIYSKIIK